MQKHPTNLGRIHQISSDGDDRRIFWGRKIKEGSFAWLDLLLSRDFWGYAKQSKDLW